MRVECNSRRAQVRRELGWVLAAVISACGTDPVAPVVSNLQLSAEALDFGPVTVGGQSAVFHLTGTNGGKAPTGALDVSVAGAAAAEFRIISDNCSGRPLAAAASCGIDLWLRPQTSGAKVAALLVEDAGRGEVSVALTGMGTVGTIALSATSLDFGPIRMGTQSIAATVTVHNASLSSVGTVSIGITGPHNADFRVLASDCPLRPLDASRSCSVNVSFSPTAAGVRTSSLEVTTSSGTTGSVALSGLSGTATQLSPGSTSRDFGTARTGTTTAGFVFTISNVGPTPSAALTARMVGSNVADFLIMLNTCTGQIVAVGATCGIQVAFAPRQNGARAATLEVGDLFGSSASMTLTGNAGSADLRSAPTSVAFPPVIVGGVGSPVLLTISNAGTLASEPIASRIESCTYDYYYYGYGSSCGPSSDFIIASDGCANEALPAGETCQISVAFSPRSRGDLTATLGIGTGFGIGVPLSGSGAGLHLVVPGLDFSPVAVGSASPPQSIILSNTANQPSGPISIDLEGSAFQIVTDECGGLPLGAGSSCTVTVRFTPATSGIHNGALSLTAVPGGSRTATLRGQAN